MGEKSCPDCGEPLRSIPTEPGWYICDRCDQSYEEWRLDILPGYPKEVKPRPEEAH